MNTITTNEGKIIKQDRNLKVETLAKKISKVCNYLECEVSKNKVTIVNNYDITEEVFKAEKRAVIDLLDKLYCTYTFQYEIFIEEFNGDLAKLY